MILRNVIFQALQSLRTNRLRSALTMLGVLWGTASVVLLMGWGRAFVEAMHRESRIAGDGFIVFWPRRALSETSGRKGARQLYFQLKDIEAVLDHCPSVRYITPADGSWSLIKRGNKLKEGAAYGVSPDALNIYNLSVTHGRFLQPDDVKNARRVCVLGATLKEALFPPGYQVLGSRVKIRGISFEVIGLLKKKGEQMVNMGAMDDERAYIPSTSFMRYISGSRNIFQIDVQPRDTHQTVACIEEVKATLAKELDFSPDDEEALEIFDLCFFLNALDTMAIVFAVFTTIVGVITLFVGGVGVMNIMLISVTQRTREIGIRKAIGAKRRHIMTQFLAEALTITALSGIIGVLLACAISFAFAAIPGRPAIFPAPEISFFTISLSLVVMVLVGLFAGTLPARRAANMEPVESLRYE